jgi:hypothetical protein
MPVDRVGVDGGLSLLNFHGCPLRLPPSVAPLDSIEFPAMDLLLTCDSVDLFGLCLFFIHPDSSVVSILIVQL